MLESQPSRVRSDDVKAIVRGHGGEPLGEELRSYVERKLNRLDRITHGETQAVVDIRAHASRTSDASNVVLITLTMNGDVLRSESAGATPRAAFDTVLDKLERQIVRHNTRPRVRDKMPAHGVPANGGDGAALDRDLGADEAGEADGAAPRIVRVKRFDIEPMFEEDAVARMDELGHSFFIFLNAETDTVCVLYRRADGNYGLIEPSVGGRRRGPGGAA